MRPDMCIDIYADADFPGLYNTKDKQDPVSIKIWTSILLTFGNVPILWRFELQSEIALSALKAEYIALSHGMRDLVSAKRLLAELGEQMNYKVMNTSHISKIWEDNTKLKILLIVKDL